MKVYYLDHMDCSGVFSSKEKAFESFMTCADRCGYADIKRKDYEGETTIYFKWHNPVNKYYNNAEAYIFEYELDEDNG